jgi:F0F1-type ATP synthase membrane subunit a
MCSYPARAVFRNSARKGNLVPAGFAGAVEAAVEAMYNLTESTAGRWTKTVFPGLRRLSSWCWFQT